MVYPCVRHMSFHFVAISVIDLLIKINIIARDPFYKLVLTSINPSNEKLAHVQ